MGALPAAVVSGAVCRRAGILNWPYLRHHEQQEHGCQCFGLQGAKLGNASKPAKREARGGWFGPRRRGCQGSVSKFPTPGENGHPTRPNGSHRRTLKVEFFLGGRAIIKTGRHFGDACRQFGDLNF